MPFNPRLWRGVFSTPPEQISPSRPILGYRLSRVRMTVAGGPVDDPNVDPSLVSAVTDFIWQPGPNFAACTGFSYRRRGCQLQVVPNRHTPPGARCLCGFYACHSIEMLAEITPLLFLGWDQSEERTVALITTGVAASGTVRIHEKGWRAEVARVVALCTELPRAVAFPDGRLIQIGAPTKVLRPPIAEALARRYGVPVVGLADLPAVMAEAGQFVEA